LSQFERGEVPAVGWLDALTVAAVARDAETERARLAREEGFMELELELETFALPAVCELPLPSVSSSSSSSSASSPPAGTTLASTSSASSASASARVAWLVDYEYGLENPSERKQQKLARGMVDRALVDRELKPDGTERKLLAKALRSPPGATLSQELRNTLWKFRYSLKADPSALTKFLQSVDWKDAGEAKQATELMEQWADVEPATGLELLSPNFDNAAVRAHGVAVLARASDEDVEAYLLQLVQALRFEAEDDSPLARFLVSRAVRNATLANFLQWYLFVELADASFSERAGHILSMFEQASLERGPAVELLRETYRRQTQFLKQLVAIAGKLESARGANRKGERLRTLLSEEGLDDELTSAGRPLPLPLDPSIRARRIVPSECTVFKSALAPLKLTFVVDDPDAEAGALDEATAAAAAAAWAKAPAEPAPPGLRKYGIIFKRGDDLRQDQVCVQLFSLMDRLLKRENLDLKLTPYRVLATDMDQGMLEFVPSYTLNSIRDKYKSNCVAKFFEAKAVDTPAAALDNFIKSCAGYCVVTYILGVGDRHLDNLMLREDGCLFHIDFGFMMGRDPKVYYPMKLSPEMLDGMGGRDTEHYKRFQTYCCEAYNILRKSANLILSLVALMAAARIPDLSGDPEVVRLKLEKYFQLDLDDEAAVAHLQYQIDLSANAVIPQVMEAAHRFAQYLR